MNADELGEIIFDEYGDPKDRFQRPDEGGVFKYFYPEDTYDTHLKDRIVYSIAEEDGKIVGIGKVSRLGNHEKRYAITSVSVDPSYKEKGHARRMLEKIFEQAKEQGWELQISAYTKEGWDRLKRIIHELAEQYGVPIIDPEEKWNWS